MVFETYGAILLSQQLWKKKKSNAGQVTTKFLLPFGLQTIKVSVRLACEVLLIRAKNRQLKLCNRRTSQFSK